MSALSVLRDALEAAGCRPRGSDDAFKARCPSCQRDGREHDPGLSVSIGRERDAVLHCHGSGQCDADTVLRSLGLEWKDLGANNGTRRTRRRTEEAPGHGEAPTQPGGLEARVMEWANALWRNTERLDFLRRERGLSDDVLLAAFIGHDGERFTVPILSEDGRVLFVKRYLPAGEPKFLTFPTGFEAALYGVETLAGLEDHALVLVTEGEMDRLLLQSLGYNAVSGTAGAKAWRQEWSAKLARFECVVIGDHDRDGAEMNRKVLDSLRKAGGYAQAFTWPEGTPAKTDPTDYIVKQGRSPDEFRVLVDAAHATGNLRVLDLRQMLTEPAKPIPWTLPRWLASGDIAGVVGEPKTLKSILMLLLALALATGRDFLGVPVHGGPYLVLYVDEENNPFLLRHRIRKLAASLGLSPEDLLNLRYLSGNALNLDKPDRLQAFFREVRRFRPEWVILDSLVRFHGRDENSNSAMAAFAAEVLKPLTSHFGAGVVFIHHMGKPSKDRPSDPAHRMRGASDLPAFVDVLWATERASEGGVTLSHCFTRWGETAPSISVTVEDSEDGSALYIRGEETANAAEAIIVESLEAGGTEGRLRQEIVSAVQAAGFKAPGKLVTKFLGRMHAERKAKKAGNNRAMRYWLAEMAPPNAE